MTRLNTKLQSTGAEFLVLGNLLINGIQAYKAYENYPGYDLIAVNHNGQKYCRVQVKSRYPTDNGGGFPIKNFECDFVVFAALNRGICYAKAKVISDDNSGVAEPVFYIFPVEVVSAAVKETMTWSKVYLRDIADADKYRQNWSLISDFLGVTLALLKK